MAHQRHSKNRSNYADPLSLDQRCAQRGRRTGASPVAARRSLLRALCDSFAGSSTPAGDPSALAGDVRPLTIAEADAQRQARSWMSTSRSSTIVPASP